MPIYEFYCSDCHAIFNFFSKLVNTEKRPVCPRCLKKTLERQVSLFSAGGRARKEGGIDDIPVDESRMEKAITALAGEAEKINEDNPQDAARLMRKFSGMTGLKFGEGIETALSRMEAGEAPEKIESEMGDILEGEEPFVVPEGAGEVLKTQPPPLWGYGGQAKRGAEPYRDEKLYEL